MFLCYLWFCVVSFVQIVKEIEFVQSMGHYEGGRLNPAGYQNVNVPEIGSEYYPRYDRFLQKNQNNFNNKYVSNRLPMKLNADNAFNNVLARPVY